MDVFDFHGYPDSPDTMSWTAAQYQAFRLSCLRDYWDPTFVSQAWEVADANPTAMQPVPGVVFRIPRLRAIVNSIYPGTPVAMTEWNSVNMGIVGWTEYLILNDDLISGLGDAEAFGIFGRERLAYATRFSRTDPDTPAYAAMMLYRNYDGNHSTFGTLSVSATHNADPDLFAVYAAEFPAGGPLTLMVINKDAADSQQVNFSVNGFAPASFTSYSISSASPSAIAATARQPWSGSQTFPPLSATLLVITGAATLPASEWDLNPDTTMLSAGKSVALHPTLLPGSAGSVTLSAVQSDPGITAAIAQPVVTSSQNGVVNITAGPQPGIYRYTVTGSDSANIVQNQSGWILVGNPSATLSASRTAQTVRAGAQVTLSVMLDPGQSGGTPAGAPILFTGDAGSLSVREVTTDASGQASVTFCMPFSEGTAHVTAEGPYGLGHPVVIFTETASPDGPRRTHEAAVTQGARNCGVNTR